MNKIKELLKNKINVYVVISVIIVLSVLILMIVLNGKNIVKNYYELNKIYDMYPNDVRDIYSNIVDVSCSGDLKFDIDVGSELDIDKINKDNLLNYMFSYMDKNNLLGNNLDVSVYTEASKKLFDMDIIKNTKSFNYNGYTYTFAKDKVGRKNSECHSDNKHVSHLYGYSYNEDGLSIDIKVGYAKDGKLYDYDNNPLGDYSGNREVLSDLLRMASYYRLVYVKKNGELKLSKVKFMRLS